MTKAKLRETELRLKEASSAYYNDGVKLMSDESFDRLKSEWEEAAGRKFEVGAAPNVSSTVNLSHSYEDLAGTLDKVVNMEELRQWVGARGIRVSRKEKLLVSLKYDGHSINFEFSGQVMKKALTRGQDGVGKDLTGYFRKAWNGALTRPIRVPDIDGESIEDFAVGFEAVISWENLERLNSEFGTSYKNPRSAIGGIIKEDGVPMAKYLTLIPLKFRAMTSAHVTKEAELRALNAVADAVDAFDSMEVIEAESVDEVEEIYGSIAESRLELDYMIDGIVVETSNQELRENLGYSDRRPNFAIAFKLPYLEKETTLIDVEWYTDGNTATYTPVAVLRPVLINGATYKKVSLANYKRFKEMGLHVGDPMLFSLNKDVLGYVDRIPSEPAEGAVRLKAPTKCVCCGGKLHNDGVFLYCVNEECDLVKIGHLQQFLEKLNVKGIKRNTIRSLYELGYLTRVEDFLGMGPDFQSRLEQEEGFGKTSARQICKAVNDRLFSESGVYDYELLGALNIEFLSRGRAMLILRKVGMATLLGEKPSRLEPALLGIDGVGKALVQAIFKNLERIESVFEAFQKRGVKIVSLSREIAANQVEGQKYTVVVTGNLKGYEREEFKKTIELLGHKMASSISRRTDFLITNDTSSGTIKNQKAMELGVKIINEAQAVELLGINRNTMRKVSIDEAFE